METTPPSPAPLPAPASDDAPAPEDVFASPDSQLVRAWRWRYGLLLLAAVAGWLLLTGMNLWFGELNQDEGWYLYAARQLCRGQMPYRDFAFTQGPMVPVVYAVFHAWVDRLGLLGARCLTAGFGLLSLLAAAWLSMRTGPRNAQRLSLGLCTILAGLNIYQSYFTTVVKTYALASAFLCWGLVLLSCASRRHAVRAAFFAGFLLACATATRASMAPALVLGWLWLLFAARHLRRWAWLDYALGAALASALFVVPFYLMGHEGFLFGLVEYHTLRAAGPLATRLALKAGALVRLLQAYFPAALATFAFLALACWDWRKRRRLRRAARPVSSPAPGFLPVLWLSIAAIFLLHLSAAFPYDDYQAPIYPLFCAALSAAIARLWVLRETAARAALPTANTPLATASRRSAILWAALAFALLYAAASPLAQAWFVSGRDRVWWNLRDRSPVAQLRDAAEWIRNINEPLGGTALLTQDIYLAVETGLDVLPGLEMGPFSYYPDWTDDRASALHVHNRDTLRALLLAQTNAPVAALSGYAFAIRSPDVSPIASADARLFRQLLADRYDHVEDIPHFGQAATTLELWRIKTAGLPPDEAAAVAARSEALALAETGADTPPLPAPDDDDATTNAPPPAAEPLRPFIDATLSSGPDPSDPATEFATPP